MFCTKCGTKLDEGSNFCTVCGTKVSIEYIEPEPIVEPEPIAEPEPAPEPIAEPEPIPEPEPIQEPEPAPEPIAEPEPIPEPEPIQEPEPAPAANFGTYSTYSDPASVNEPYFDEDDENLEEEYQFEIDMDDDVQADPRKQKKKEKKQRPEREIPPQAFEKPVKKQKGNKSNVVLIVIISILSVLLLAGAGFLYILNSDEYEIVWPWEETVEEVSGKPATEVKEEPATEVTSSAGDASTGKKTPTTSTAKKPTDPPTDPPVKEPKIYDKPPVDDIMGEVATIEKNVAEYKKCKKNYHLHKNAAADYYTVGKHFDTLAIIDILPGHGLKELRDSDCTRSYIGSAIYYVEVFDESTGQTDKYYYAADYLIACTVDGQSHVYGESNWEEYDDMGELLKKEFSNARNNYQE